MARSKRDVRRYESEGLTVLYDVKRCIHAAECVHGLPEVFDPDRRPWVDPSKASTDEIARVVRRCPTGALRYQADDPSLAESLPATNTVRPAPAGPLYLSGRLRIEMPDGSLLDETRAALCRCGASSDKPFCDGSHARSGFEDGGGLGEDRLGSRDASTDELEIRSATDGPLVVSGPLRVEAADGDQAHEGDRGALCRCGASRNKPYCDGSHAEIGWRSETEPTPAD